MAGKLKISGTMIFRCIGIILIFFFNLFFIGMLLIFFARRLSNALGLDEKLEQLGSAVRSRPRKSTSARKARTKKVPRLETLAPCPYCGRDIKPTARKCRYCNHRL